MFLKYCLMFQAFLNKDKDINCLSNEWRSFLPYSYYIMNLTKNPLKIQKHLKSQVKMSEGM